MLAVGANEHLAPLKHLEIVRGGRPPLRIAKWKLDGLKPSSLCRGNSSENMDGRVPVSPGLPQHSHLGCGANGHLAR